MDSLYNLIGTIIVGIIGLIGIWIQTKSKEKQDNVLKQITKLREESKHGDERLYKNIDDVKCQFLKMWLTNELTKVRDELYRTNEEQKRIIMEAKKEYNRLGGDSYVDDMFDECKDKNLL